MLTQNDEKYHLTRQYRQTIGLLVSEHWSGGEGEAIGDESSPVSIVARHLRQSAGEPPSDDTILSKRQSLTDASMNHQSPHLHPGYIPSSMLKSSKLLRPPTKQDDIYYPTCATCFGPLQPGAFGSTTRIVAAMDKSLKTMSSSQKRRLRKRRRKMHKERQHQQQSSSTPTGTSTSDFAKWYEHAYELQNEAYTPGMTAKHLVSVTCGACQSSHNFPIPVANQKNSSMAKNDKKKPSFMLSQTRSNTAAVTTSSPHHFRKNKPSNNTEEGFIPLDGSPRKRPTVENSMPSMLMPKKRKKKKPKSNQLMEFLSSLNDH